MAVRYITKRQYLIERQEVLAAQIAEIRDALNALIIGKITSYNIGSASISRSQTDLDKLRDYLKALELEFEENDATLRGHSRRCVEVQYYQNPTNTRYM